jgi:hypothetical protein
MITVVAGMWSLLTLFEGTPIYIWWCCLAKKFNFFSAFSKSHLLRRNEMECIVLRERENSHKLWKERTVDKFHQKNFPSILSDNFSSFSQLWHLIWPKRNSALEKTILFLTSSFYWKICLIQKHIDFTYKFDYNEHTMTMKMCSLFLHLILLLWLCDCENLCSKWNQKLVQYQGAK